MKTQNFMDSDHTNITISMVSKITAPTTTVNFYATRCSSSVRMGLNMK